MKYYLHGVELYVYEILCPRCQPDMLNRICNPGVAGSIPGHGVISL